jgi:predicted YcjX-like family ATPase
LHHQSHDRLEAVLRRAVAKAADACRICRCGHRRRRAIGGARHARGAGGARPRQAAVHHRHARARRDRQWRGFDGETEVATFPGDLPADPEELFNGGFRGLSSTASEQADFRFLRFRPPLLERTASDEPALPHIRLDRPSSS